MVYYEIRVRGQLDRRWRAWFVEMELTYPEAGVTLLAGRLPDQAALHGLLERIRDLNLALISVTTDTPRPLSEGG